ncbi:MAG TPA: hypothetical protein VGF85_11925 [Opitutaceae bacterium]|jgi:hypothetical protein
MKKTTKTEKSPAPAIKTTAPTRALKLAAPASASKAVAAAPLAAAARKTVKKTTPPALAASSGPATPAPMAAPKASSVTVTAKIDVGFGNALFLRGSGAGLSWNKGMPLVCIATDAWSLVLPSASEPFAFKFLLNDAAWSTGKDYLAGPGDTVTVTPVF